MSETHQNMQNNPKSSDKPSDSTGSDSTGQKSLLEEYEESLENESNALPKEAQEMLEVLESDEEFNKEMEELMSAIEAGTIDLTVLQSKFLLLIKSTLGRLNKGKSKALEHILKGNEQDILDQLTTLSHHMMMQKTPLVQEATLGVQNPKDKYSNLTAAAIESTKQILKRFAVYEVYKIMNPRRISGETSKDNFVSNFVTGGIRRAMKYESKELQKASPQEIKQLSKAHGAFKKSGGRGL